MSDFSDCTIKSLPSSQVPKLNRGLRAQVIVKKVNKVQKMDSAGEQSEEEELDEEDLFKGRSKCKGECLCECQVQSCDLEI